MGGLRHLIQILLLRDGSLADMLHSRAQCVRCIFTRPAMADLRHSVAPCINVRRIVVLTDMDLEPLQRRSQFVALQANLAQLRNQCQIFLTREPATVAQPTLEAC